MAVIEYGKDDGREERNQDEMTIFCDRSLSCQGIFDSKKNPRSARRKEAQNRGGLVW